MGKRDERGMSEVMEKGENNHFRPFLSTTKGQVGPQL